MLYIDLEAEKLSKTTYTAIALMGVVVSVLSVNLGIAIGNTIDNLGWYNGGLSGLESSSSNIKPIGSHSFPHPHMFDSRHLMSTVTDPQVKLTMIRDAITTASTAPDKGMNMTGLSKYLKNIPLTVAELSTAATSAKFLPEVQAAHWIVNNDIVDGIGNVEDHVIRRFALAVMYYTTEGNKSWTNTTNWLDPNSVHCDWFGITCCRNFLFSPVCADPEADKYAVTELDLHNNSLMGPVPYSVPLLKDIQAVCFSNNYLNGTIPPDFVHASTNPKLLKIYFHHNQLEGEIPDLVGESVVDNYYVHGNNLNGTWPLCNMVNDFQYFTVDCLEVDCECCTIHQHCYASVPRLRPGERPKTTSAPPKSSSSLAPKAATGTFGTVAPVAVPAPKAVTTTAGVPNAVASAPKATTFTTFAPAAPTMFSATATSRLNTNSTVP